MKPSKLETIASLADERAECPRVGRVVAFAGGEARVQLKGRAAPVTARVTAALDDRLLARAASERQEAVLLFEDDDPQRPIVVALLRSRTPLVDAVLEMPRAEKVAGLDGERVILEAKEEVVLRCGKASLTLRKDGKAVLRGVNVVTQARQVHKIRGGKVQIN